MKPILTMDFETDPFKHGRRVYPFAVGVYGDSGFYSCWSRACVKHLLEYLKKLPPSVIYMHNGGRFDIFFLMAALDAQMKIIKGRVVEAQLGEHLVRDSFAILPMALAQYKKDEIDINKLNRENREQNKEEILSYLRGDCVYLHELVSGFLSEFGEYLTIGSAAMGQLRKFHPFDKGSKYLDDKFRKQFFFGGRVQCFRAGVIEQPFKIYDVNSMYPYVMKNFKHPTGGSYELDTRIRNNTYFIVAEGRQRGPYGAFPIRNRSGGIDFNVERGTFATTIHEWNAAEEAGYFRPSKILKTYSFSDSICFDEFVDHFYSARLKAKAEEDRLHEIFYKFILNSAYGKFAQNPDNFADWAITQNERLAAPWREHFIHRKGKYVIWKKGVNRHSYYNVCIGASITGAARATLMRAIRFSEKPLYCDTDSIIASELKGVSFDSTQLGAWKLEGSGDRIAIAGKKMYSCWQNGELVKKATKGAKLTADEILAVAQGKTVTYKNAAPTFKLNGRVDFITRKIKRTVDDVGRRI
jgi:hypothetical protein